MHKNNQTFHPTNRFKANQETEAPNRLAFLVEFTPETLRMIRTYRKLTQARLARQAHMSADYLSEIERGVSHPSAEVLGRLGSALQCIFFK